ncbi:MAG: hypothetical protein IJ389_01610 [Clostridia bacterium]|nr:hypothetical protein [Clostridia bacterium]
MKRIVAVLTVVCIMALSACAANPRCEYEEISNALSEAEAVRCYVYSDEVSYEIEGSAVSHMVDGMWEKTSKPADFEKILSITVSTQYEIGFFEDGNAIVYSGYAGVFEKDRQYYSCKTNSSFDEIIEMLRENGFLVVDDEVKASDEANLYDAPNGNQVGVLKGDAVAFRSGKRADGWCKLEYEGKTVYAIDSSLVADGE